MIEHYGAGTVYSMSRFNGFTMRLKTPNLRAIKGSN